MPTCQHSCSPYLPGASPIGTRARDTIPRAARNTEAPKFSGVTLKIENPTVSYWLTTVSATATYVLSATAQEMQCLAVAAFWWKEPLEPSVNPKCARESWT